MANNYYNRVGDFVPGTRVRSGNVDAELDAVAVGFDLLPTAADALTTGKATFAGVSAGTGDAYTVSMPDTRLSNANGDEVVFFADRTNTGVATLNVDSLGPISMVRTDGVVLAAGDIQLGVLYVARYDLANTRFQLTSPSASFLAAAAASAAASAASAAASSTSAGDSAASAAASLVSENIAAEWAANVVDNDISTSPGQFSSLHWASGSSAWAIQAEDSAIVANFGGDGATTFSALHWAAKAEASAADVTQVTGTGTDLPSAPGTSNANLPWRNRAHQAHRMRICPGGTSTTSTGPRLDLTRVARST